VETVGTNLRGIYPFTADLLPLTLLMLYNQCGIRDINRAFSFRNNPQFIFHVSPGFESGDEKQLKEVQSFIEQRGKATNAEEQLHAIWLVSLFYFIIFVHGLL
jgi:hypothetical protein